jgi:2',3'-cyclic-nucleotide 2'-phosphodiesterase (5'-nucleotidase family)
VRSSTLQARSSGTALGVVTLSYLPELDRVVDHTIDIWTTRHSAGVHPNGAIADLVAEYRAEVAEIADAPIARLADTLSRERAEESALGDLIADAQRSLTEVGYEPTCRLGRSPSRTFLLFSRSRTC